MKKIVLGLWVLLAPLIASATVISWDSGNANYVGSRDASTGEVACSAGDICATSQSWNVPGVTVTAEAYDAASGTGVVNSNNRIVLWHDKNLALGGLGGAPASDLGDSSKDNNTGKESIHLTFSQAIMVNSLFFNGDHKAYSGNIWVGGDGGGGIVDNVFNNGVLAIGFMVSELYIEPDFDFLPSPEWYLSGMSYSTVPEPASLSMLVLGLLGLVYTRRKQSL